MTTRDEPVDFTTGEIFCEGCGKSEIDSPDGYYCQACYEDREADRKADAEFAARYPGSTKEPVESQASFDVRTADLPKDAEELAAREAQASPRPWPVRGVQS